MVCSEFYDVTSAGKLFHVRAEATGNARSPTVESHVDGTSNADVDNDRIVADVVDLESWRPAEECRPGRPVQVHGRTGTQYTMTASLNDMRCGTRSQCRHRSI